MAAPIRTDDAIEHVVAHVLEIDEARERLRVLAPHEPTPLELIEDFQRAEAAFESVFAPALQRALLAELATWPAKFHFISERVEAYLNPEQEWPRRAQWIHHEALRRWRQFAEGRGLMVHEHTASECGCHCRGFNDLLKDHLRQIRGAYARVHAVRSKKARIRRREDLAEAKRDLLETMWWHGLHRVDRASLRQHAVEITRTLPEPVTSDEYALARWYTGCQRERAEARA